MLLQVDFEVLEAVFLPPETLRPERGQPVAVLLQVHQGEAGAQPVMVLGQAAVSHPVEAELPLQHAKDMFYFGPYFRLSCLS